MKRYKFENYMEAKELRIGNLIRFISTETIEVVMDIDTKRVKKPSINNINITDVDSILLTEEWLFRLGFEFNFKTNRFDFDGWRFFITKPANYNGFLLCEGNTVITDKIKYVHQLQNLYFSLTGEELTVSS